MMEMKSDRSAGAADRMREHDIRRLPEPWKLAKVGGRLTWLAVFSDPQSGRMFRMLWFVYCTRGLVESARASCLSSVQVFSKDMGSAIVKKAL